MTFITIDGRKFNLPVIKFKYSVEILDSEASGRMQAWGWPLFREPQGIIKNVEAEFGIVRSDEPELPALLAVLDGFGTRDFAVVSFITPQGTVTQEMYGASYTIEMKRVIKDDIAYWGTLPVKFVAKKAVDV